MAVIIPEAWFHFWWLVPLLFFALCLCCCLAHALIVDENRKSAGYCGELCCLMFCWAVVLCPFTVYVPLLPAMIQPAESGGCAGRETFQVKVAIDSKPSYLLYLDSTYYFDQPLAVYDDGLVASDASFWCWNGQKLMSNMDRDECLRHEPTSGAPLSFERCRNSEPKKRPGPGLRKRERCLER